MPTSWSHSEDVRLKDCGVTTLIFWVTWRHLSCDYWIRNMRFPIGGRFELTVYLARFMKAWNILGSPNRISLQVVSMSVCHFVLKLCRNGYEDDIQFYRRLATTFRRNHLSKVSSFCWSLWQRHELRGGAVENVSIGARPYLHDHELSVPDWRQ